MAIKIKSIRKSVQNKGIKILVHGLAGAGKTVLCCTTGEPTLLISAESGLLSVRNAPSYIKVAEVESIQDLHDLYDFLVEDLNSPSGPRFKWVALDSITEIAEALLSHEKKINNDPRKAYMNTQDEILKLLRKYRDIPHYHVVMSCKQARGEDEGKKLYLPEMPGQKLGPALPYLFDEVFALRVEVDDNGNTYRVLQTNRDAKYDAKDRSGALKFFEKPNLKSIAKKISADFEIERELPSEDAAKEAKEAAKKEALSSLDAGLNPEELEAGKEESASQEVVDEDQIIEEEIDE